jgi:cytochrome oxidase Cu insertion factor (SCO1/SenC/PrrC family)
MTARTSQILLILSAFLTGLVVFTGVFLYATGNLSGTPNASAIGGPFKLIDQNGSPISDADINGRPFLVFFGYTHCPDVCPTTLFDVSEIMHGGTLHHCGSRTRYTSGDERLSVELRSASTRGNRRSRCD